MSIKGRGSVTSKKYIAGEDDNKILREFNRGQYVTFSVTDHWMIYLQICAIIQMLFPNVILTIFRGFYINDYS